ncbi:PPR domain-containing protein/PPR_2 domain-containing protein/PPR_3 domain-containing protein, partial [Cephalotus follicularis]
KLHACIFSYGLQDNVFLGSKLLTSYAKFGFLAESRWVFDRIINCNLSLWSSIFVGYFRTGHHREVLWRYFNLKERNVGVDGAAITFCLKSCIELGSLDFGKGVHVDALKFGLGSDRYVGSSLIGLYSRYGDIEDASKVFDEVSERDVVVCTSMITAFAQIGDHRAYEAFGVVDRMLKEQLYPNRVTLVSLLQAAAQLGGIEEGRVVHGYATRRGIGCFDEVFETSLMDMYIKCGAPRMAACVFREMRIRTIGSWNAMIAGHLQIGQPLEALDLFYLMVREKVLPDLITLANVMLCCADLKYLLKGKIIHGYIVRSGIQLDVIIATALVDVYSKCNRLIQARKLFDGMETRDVILYNVMITGYLQNNVARDAVEIFIDMVETDIKPNLGSILSVLSALSDLKDIRQGRCVHGYALRLGFHSNNEISNQIIYMYAKGGSITYARRVFNWIDFKDLVTWTTMMTTAYGLHGRCLDALKLFNQMKTENIDPDAITFTSILSACSHSGLVEDGLRIFKSIGKQYSRIPCEEHYACMVDLLSRAGRLEEAYDLVKCPPTRQTASALGALLAACRLYKNTRLGEVVGRRLLDMEPENPSAYALVSNFYAEGGKWDEVARLRGMAKKRGLRRTPGYSLIEL